MGHSMPAKPSSTDFAAFIYGFFGVLIFSLTLPATRMAVAELDPVFVGLGRAIGAAGLSLILLLATRQPLPSWRLLPRFGIVVAGVVIGFPLLSALAMHDAPAAHGSVITGLVPLATALCAVWRGGERPAPQFWLFAGVGSLLVLGFALISGAGSLRVADVALLGAVAAAGLGYAEGAVLSRSLGAWQVICWSLVLAVPVLLPVVLQHRPAVWPALASPALWGFIYLSLFSMWLGFFAWYRGLCLGGIARIGQIQLLQPFLTLSASAAFLGEKITPTMLIFAVGVILCVAWGKRASIKV